VLEDDLTHIRAGGWALPRRTWRERVAAARLLPRDLAKRAARRCAAAAGMPARSGRAGRWPASPCSHS